MMQLREVACRWLVALLLAAGAGASGMGAVSLAAQDVFTQADPEVVPVVLVPGWADEAPMMEPLRRRLADGGWPEARVSALTFDDPVGSNEENARQIAQAVEVLKGLTGASRVDVVAHSMGGLAVRHYLLFEGGAQDVRRVVFLATPHRGTVAAMLAWGEGGRQMVPGSEFLNRLNDGGIPGGVEALAIRTPVDLRVIPASSALLPGALNLEICCPTHTQLVDDDQTADRVMGFLRHGAEGVPEAETPDRRARGSDRVASPFELWRPWDGFRGSGDGSRWFGDAWADRWGDTWDQVWDDVMSGEGWDPAWARSILRRWFLPSTEALTREGNGDRSGEENRDRSGEEGRG